MLGGLCPSDVALVLRHCPGRASVLFLYAVILTTYCHIFFLRTHRAECSKGKEPYLGDFLLTTLVKLAKHRLRTCTGLGRAYLNALGIWGRHRFKHEERERGPRGSSMRKGSRLSRGSHEEEREPRGFVRRPRGESVNVKCETTLGFCNFVFI
ncbi:hypothetical protein Sjap_008391 [Stephania japonica]|uniref:Uncharacterized protein n=1 Tax=Stephania japonica TaxID=461633 RepID=A0AAP0PBA9_9MAGN